MRLIKDFLFPLKKWLKATLRYNPPVEETAPFPGNAREAAIYKKIRASSYFDESWYQLAYRSEIRFQDDLLADYIRVGISRGRDPSPYFNTTLYLREQNVPADRALVHFLRSGRAAVSGAYRNEQALQAAQRAFMEQTVTSLITDRRKIAKPFAIYLQCGAGSMWDSWRMDEGQPWHLLINHYDPTFAGKIPCDVEFRQTGALPGTKFTSMYNILDIYPHILDPYEYILLLDDDILLEQDELARMFITIQQNGWEMAQPSLSRDSFGSYPVFYNSGKAGWRQVNGVEIMMPVYSRRILGEVKDLLAQSISGWGVDAALSVLAGERGYKAVVLDEVTARHARPINADIGRYYQMLHRAGIYPEVEFTHLQKKFGFTKPLFRECSPSG